MKMKYYLSFIPLLSLCTLLLGISSCSSEVDDPAIGQGEGKLRIALKADGQTAEVSTRAAAVDPVPEVGDFSLTLLRKGEIVSSWEKFSQYPDEASFRVGSYTLEASYGKLEEEGFEKPCFFGTADFAVRGGETSQVEVTCQLQNCLVSLLYTEAFKKYFSAYTAKVNSEGHNPVVYTAEESRAAYFMPGKILLNLEVTKRESGTKVQLLAVTIDEALPRHHYRLTCDVNAGSQTLTVSFDDATEVEPVEINVSEDALLADPPFCVAHGFTPEEPVVLTEGQVLETPISIYMNARAGLSQVLLKSISPALESQGWPAEFDLAHPTAEQEALLTRFGVKRVGLGDRMEQIATVDLTQLLSFIPYDEAKTANDRFELTVVDRNHRCNDTPLQLQVKVISNGFALEDPEPVSFGANILLFKMHLEGDPLQVTATCATNGVEQPLTLEVVSSEGNVHLLRATLPTSLAQESTLKVTLGSKTLSAPIKMLDPQFEVKALSSGDVWATHATLTVVGDNEATTAYLRDKTITVEYAPAGTEDWVKPTQQRMGDQIVISGLPEDAEKENSYILRATAALGGKEVAAKSISEITTERALQLPGGNLDEWNEEATRKLAKGKWNGLNKTTYVSYLPANGLWGTSNKKTFSYGSDYAINSYPSVVTEAHGDGVAAVIRSIGWTNGIGNDYWSVCDNYSSGRLFIGSSDFDLNSMLDNYQYGMEFTSRPSSISFDLKYDSYNNDQYKVWAVVEHREGETVTQLARQEITGGAEADYARVTLNLGNYTDASKKATHFYIVFASSYLCNDDHATESAVMKNYSLLHVVDNSYWGGSTLWIDNIQLNY